jgi:hypothetical protein
MKRKAETSLRSVVEKQIAENNPPEAKQALERLVQGGLTKEKAIVMLTGALTYEMYFMLKEERAYSSDKYVKRLNRLPFDLDYDC